MSDPNARRSRDTWLRRYLPRPAAGARIVCFGPAGGSPGFFKDWAQLVPGHVELQIVALPGRERRFLDDPIEDMAELADTLHDVLAPVLDRPTLLFGHSMGASVAFETARRLEASGARHLAGLVLSGRHSPHAQRETPSEAADFDDDRIVQHLEELGGTPPGFLDDPDARELILPAFRSDFRLIGRYVPGPGPKLRTPLAVLHGDRDVRVTAEDTPRWAEEAEQFLGSESLPGGHFYLLDRPDAVVARLLAVLGGSAGARAGEPGS
ncbi:thioesterase II family protein [Kitasatospora sp. NPDC001574]